MCTITKLNMYDVLCGRGSVINEWVGNKNFRDFVGARKAEYLAINPRDHRNKNRIANEIIESVRSRGGRFLKKATMVALEGESEVYELADEKTVLEKAKQALRQNIRQGNKTEIQSHQGAAKGQPSMMHERAAQHFFSSDPYQAFLLHIHMQQASVQQHQYGMNLASVSTQDALMQSYMTAQHQHALSGQNPLFGTAPGMPVGMVDPRDVLRPHQQRHHAMPNITMSGPQPDNLASLGTASGDVASSDYIRHQMQVLGGGGGHDAAPTVSTLHAREEHDEYTVVDASPSSVRLSLTEEQMTALEKLFISSSQKKAKPGALISQHQRSESRSFNQKL